MKNLSPIFLLIFLMFTSLNPIWAQNYEPGHIILSSGDTLYGQIKDRSDWDLFRKIRFKNDKGRSKKYTAKDILGYTVGINTYESKWFAEETDFFRFNHYNRPRYGEKVFLKVLSKGPLNVYAKEFVYDDNSFVDQYELFQREGETIMQRATQSVFGLKKKRLTSYFWDCPVLVEKINNGSLKDALEVAKFYNKFCAQ
jgi:hypothetical protein